MRRTTAFQLLVLLAGLWPASRVYGQPVRLGTSGHGRQVTLTVNYQAVAALHARSGSSASERANTALSRLSGLAKSGQPVHFTSGRASGGWAVLANGGVVIIAGPADAKALRLKRRTLTRRWASAFARAWALPLVRLSARNITVPAGSDRSLRITGVGRGAPRVSVSPSGIVAARVSRGGLSFRGVTPGRGTVTVWRDGASSSVDFRVMKWAGSVRPVYLEVTGNAVPRELIQTLVRSESSRGLRLEPGAWSVTESSPALPAVWTHGQSMKAYLGVRLAGSGYLPVSARIPLVVSRRRLPAEPRVDLFYSNNPESVEAPQVLFQHTVKPGTPARLLYHHQNNGERALVIAVDLRNTSGRAARVQIVDAAADPAVDTVYVGHQAAFRYFKRTKVNAGIIVEIPPHSERRLCGERVAPGETASGLMVVRPLNGEGVSLSTVAETPGNRAPSAGSRKEATTVFGQPDQTLEAAYSVGDAWTYIPIGSTPVTNEAGLKLDGNYGVVYTVRIRLANPTGARKSVKVFFEPRAGEARAAMLVDGSLRETGRAIPPAEIPMASYSLAPHQKKTVVLVTMPAAGSSYPAALIVHA